MLGAAEEGWGIRSSVRTEVRTTRNMPANLENSAVAQDWKRSLFVPIPKKGNAKHCSNYCTIILISHAGKVMLKILQARLQQYVN